MGTAKPWPAKSWPDRRAIWRWHFYAGIVCIPFVLWLAATGALYLFKPQIEAAIDAPYDHLRVANAAPPSRQVEAALAAVPGAHFSAYQLPQSLRQATRVLVSRNGEKIRVYMHPGTLAVLKTVTEEDRFMRRLFRLHGELMIGTVGSAIVEIAACWAIVLLLSGLVLWWPRERNGLGGVVYPRLRAGGRVFWRDLHGVLGFWVSACALFLIVTGLPWAKFWGDYLKEVRAITRTADGPQDWSNGAPTAPMHDMHAEHRPAPAPSHDTAPLAALDRIVPTVAALNLADPVLIAPPQKPALPWSAKSDAQNRPLRADATLDAEGRLLDLRGFSQRHPIDQAIGYGIAAHEGKLFGPANLALSLLTAFGLIGLCVSAVVLWLMRRPPDALGAPEMLARPRFSGALVAAAATMAVLFPLLGASLVLVFLCERLILRRIAPVRAWLGLTPPPVAANR